MKKKYLILMLFAVLLLPVMIIYSIIQIFHIEINGETWLSFCGGYIGSVISASIALYVLWKQLIQNHNENKKNRNLQASVFKYGQEQAHLLEIRKALVNFQVSFDYLAINRIVERMISGNYLKEDYVYLCNLVRDVDEKAFAVDTLIYDIPPSEYLEDYNLIFNQLYNRYGFTIGDFIFFFDLIQGLPEDTKIVSYVEEELNNSVLIDTNRPPIPGFVPSKSINSIIKETGDYVNIKKNAPEILKRRLHETIQESSYKEKLKEIIINLVENEQKRIDNLLTERDNV